MTDELTFLRNRVTFLETVVERYVELLGPLDPTGYSRRLLSPISIKEFKDLDRKHIKFVWRAHSFMEQYNDKYDGTLVYLNNSWHIVNGNGGTNDHNYDRALASDYCDYVEVWD